MKKTLKRSLVIILIIVAGLGLYKQCNADLEQQELDEMILNRQLLNHSEIKDTL